MTLHLDAVTVAAQLPDPAWGFGFGGAVFILSAPATWASLHLRGKTHLRLRKPVDIAFAGLTERAVEKLQDLQARLNAVLPDSSQPFNPGDVVVDPSSLQKPVKHGIRALKERNAIHRQFRWILRVCSILKTVAIAFTSLVLVSTALYFFAFTSTWLWQASCWISAAMFAIAVILVSSYAVLDARIQQSIEHADPIETHSGDDAA
ncbi:hypothetical protein [Arthrobacter sp. NtRootA1]|uniref:hypothetical protein n=1 Tax=Arthrobacter sp. NtRootA1 TaxID=2830983 RepID=UPI001CC6F856|nr:hypothetical protein [Arthrobacter sp. NtRootA1]